MLHLHRPKRDQCPIKWSLIKDYMIFVCCLILKFCNRLVWQTATKNSSIKNKQDGKAINFIDLQRTNYQILFQHHADGSNNGTIGTEFQQRNFTRNYKMGYGNRKTSLLGVPIYVIYGNRNRTKK